MMRLTIALLALTGFPIISVMAQEPQPAAPRLRNRTPNWPRLFPKRALTVREKYFYTVNRSFGAQPLLIAVAGAGGDASCRASCL